MEDFNYNSYEENSYNIYEILFPFKDFIINKKWVNENNKNAASHAWTKIVYMINSNSQKSELILTCEVCGHSIKTNLENNYNVLEKFILHLPESLFFLEYCDVACEEYLMHKALEA